VSPWLGLTVEFPCDGFLLSHQEGKYYRIHVHHIRQSQQANLPNAVIDINLPPLKFEQYIIVIN